MSGEMLMTLFTGFGLLLGLAGAFAWSVNRMDRAASRLDERISSVNSDLKSGTADLRTELKHDIAESRTELKRGITELRTELKDDIAELRTELKGDIADLRTGLSATNRELSEMRVAIARLEGPRRPALILPK